MDIPKRLDHLPDWLFAPPKENNEKQIFEDMLSLFFWKEMDNILSQHPGEEDKFLEDTLVRAKTMARAGEKAFVQQLTLQDTFQRASVWTVKFLKETGLLSLLDGEYDSIAEFLLSKTGPDDDPKYADRNREIHWMIDLMLPMAGVNGIAPEQMLGIAENYSKARILLPIIKEENQQMMDRVIPLREKLSVTNDPGERQKLRDEIRDAMELSPEGREAFSNLLESLSNPNETVAKFKEKISRRIQPHIDPVQAYNSILPRGNLVLIEVPDETTRRTIELALGSLAEWHLSSAKEIVQIVGKYIKGEPNGSH